MGKRFRNEEAELHRSVAPRREPAPALPPPPPPPPHGMPDGAPRMRFVSGQTVEAEAHDSFGSSFGAAGLGSGIDPESYSGSRGGLGSGGGGGGWDDEDE